MVIQREGTLLYSTRLRSRKRSRPDCDGLPFRTALLPRPTDNQDSRAFGGRPVIQNESMSGGGLLVVVFCLVHRNCLSRNGNISQSARIPTGLSA